jgi:hypothetical protein
MYSRKLALSLAKRYRTCPPPEIADDPAHREYFEQHLMICPYCTSNESKDQKHWDELIKKYQKDFSISSFTSNQKKIQQGQLRLIRPDLSGWRNGYFYNLPVVMVLEDTREISDDIQVAQTYHDIHLAAPGDLILSKKQTKLGQLFVECWNTYTLRANYLGPVIGQVSLDIVQTAMAMEKNPETMPDWGFHTIPLAVHDPRIYFRELEVEVGYIFASQAVDELMANLEGSFLELVYSSPQETMDEIKEKLPGIFWPGEPRTVEAVLATAQFPSDQYARAAADDVRERFRVNLVLIRNGRVKSIEPLQGEIFQSECTSEGLAVGGHVLKLPEELSGSIFLCFFQSEKEGLVEPFSSKWDENERLFLAKFDIWKAEAGKLKIALVFQLNTE